MGINRPAWRISTGTGRDVGSTSMVRVQMGVTGGFFHPWPMNLGMRNLTWKGLNPSLSWGAVVVALTASKVGLGSISQAY
ncbi:MAG: hypothetical protein GY778_01745 [bacterium]|nr:hypothetical protein [bacterium]